MLPDFSGVPGRRFAVGPKGGEEPVTSPVKSYRMTPNEIVQLEAKWGLRCGSVKGSPILALGDPVIELGKRKTKE